MPPEKFIFLEHTADAKFRAFGSSLDEAFANAALAMFSIMTDVDKVEGVVRKEVRVRGDDLKQLLVNFLEEFIFLLDAENFLLHRVESLHIRKRGTAYALDAQAAGDTFSDKYTTHGDVKAATYNDMEIHDEKGKSMVQVVVDI